MVRREFLNRKTAAACYGYDSKAGLSKLVRQHLGDTHITTDQVLRVRSNLGLILKMRDGREFQPDCQGEVFLSERTFLNKFAVGGLMPKVIFSTENLGSYIDFPDFSRDLLLIYTPGDDTVLTEKFLQLLPHSCPHFHFGDLDARGQAIARRLSLNCPQPMRIFAPEFWGEFATTFLTLEKVWPEDAHEIESPIIEGLKREGQWLEQEGIALDPRLDRAIRDVIDNAIVFAE